MNVLFIDPYEFVIIVNNEFLQHIVVDATLTEYSQTLLYTFQPTGTTTNKKLIQANKQWIIFEDNAERYLFSKVTKEINKVSLNYVLDTCVDLTNLLYGSRQILGDLDNVIRSLSQNFDYTQIGSTLYGFCKLYDSYIIIKIDEQLHFTRLVNHCGPTDVRPFENGKYIEIFDNKPVIRNSERLFIIDVEQKSIYMENQFMLTNGLLFLRNLYYSNGQYITPRRGISQIIGASNKIVITKSPNSSEPFVIHSFQDLYSETVLRTTSTSTIKMRHFLFMTTTNEHDITSILQQLKTRSAQLIVTSTSTRKFCVVSTCIRMDSFLNSVKNLFLQNSMYMYHDYIFTEFDTFENAQIFAERFVM